MAVGGKFADELFESLESEFLVGHFASAESEGGFDLHFLAEEVDGMAQLHFEVVRIDGGRELDFFDAIGVLVFFGFFLSFGEFVAVFAIIHQAADGRDSVRSDLDEVDLAGPGEVDGIAEGQNAELLAFDTDDTDFTGTDFPVDPNERAGRWGTEIGALQDTPNG